MKIDPTQALSNEFLKTLKRYLVSAIQYSVLVCELNSIPWKYPYVIEKITTIPPPIIGTTVIFLTSVT